MDTLIEIAAFLVSGGIGVFLYRILRSNTSIKENQQVTIEVDEIAKKNDEFLKAVENNLNAAKKKTDELEKEKNKDQTNQQLEDFFNQRKQ